MAMYTVLIKNNSGLDRTIEDLGITVLNASQTLLSDGYNYHEIAGSDDLRALVTAGNLEVNDGVGDLNATIGVKYLTLINDKTLEANYWDKTELAATGGANDRVDYSQIQNTPTIGSPNTLDGAYDEGGAGAGRTITADAGAVKIDASASSLAPLELVPTTSLPTTGLADGQFSVKGGIPFVYDADRSKFVSVERELLSFGRAGNTKNQFLNFGVGELPSNNSGFRMIRDAVITGMSGQLDAAGNCTVAIRKNSEATNIATMAIATPVLGNQMASLNINLNQGDSIQGFLQSVDKVEDPVALVEIAWRN